MSPTPESPKASRLLNLPVELRLEILQFIEWTRQVVQTGPFSRPSQTDPEMATRQASHATMLSLFLMCRLIHSEAMELFQRANGFVHVVTNYDHSSSDLKAAGISSLNSGIIARDFLHHDLKAIIIFHSCKSIGEYHLTLFAVDLYRVGLLLRILFPFQMHPSTMDLTVLTTLFGPDGPVSATQMMKWCFSAENVQRRSLGD